MKFLTNATCNAAELHHYLAEAIFSKGIASIWRGANFRTEAYFDEGCLGLESMVAVCASPIGPIENATVEK